MFNLTIKHFYRTKNGQCSAAPNEQQNCRHFKKSLTAKYLICEYDRLNLCGWDAVDHVVRADGGAGLMDYSRRGQCIGDTGQQLKCDYFVEDKSGRYDQVCAHNQQGRCVRNLSKNGHCTAAITDQPVCCDYRPMFCGGGMCRHYKMGMVCDA